MSESKCLGHPNPDIWFSDSIASIGWVERTEAKRICGTCAVSAQCLNFAVTRREEYGIFGGLTAPERNTPNAERRQYNHFHQ